MRRWQGHWHLTVSETNYIPRGTPSRVLGNWSTGFGDQNGYPSGISSDKSTKAPSTVPITKPTSVQSETPTKYRFQFIFPIILGSNVCQFHTSLAQHYLVKTSLFAIYYKVHYSGNVSGVFGVLTITVHTNILLSIQYNNRCLLWNQICIIVQQLIVYNPEVWRIHSC